jgi:hypothetical protein
VPERLRRAHRGVELPVRGFGGSAPEFFFFFFRADIFPPGRHISGMTYYRDDIFWDHMILGGFSAHGFLPMVFYFRLRN